MSVTKKMRVAIQAAMDGAGLNQSTLAEKTKLQRATICNLLNGRTPDVRLSTLKKIAGACKCKVGDLLGE